MGYNREEALHAKKLVGVQTGSDTAWASMGDVDTTSVQDLKQQEPSGQLGLTGATLAGEGNEVNETLFIVDPESQIKELGSKRELSVSHSGPVSRPSNSTAQSLPPKICRLRCQSLIRSGSDL